jgi:hypothetical protein
MALVSVKEVSARIDVSEAELRSGRAGALSCRAETRLAHA